MKTEKIHELLKIAKKAAIAAGNVLAESTPALRQVNKEADKDIKIEADIQSEKIIIDILQKETDYPLLSEEKGFVEGKDGEYFWIIDPVDGSLNYARGIPLCCLSIGLWKDKEPVFGIIYNFNTNEMYSGIAQGGAWINDEPIKVSQVNEKKRAVLATGFPSKMDYSEDSITSFVDQVQSYKKMRLFGSAALSVAYVASGLVEGYLEKNIMLWDIAGGIPIVLGAGGKINLLKETGSSPYSYDIHVTNGLVE